MKRPKIRVTIRFHNSGHVRDVPIIFPGGGSEAEVEDGNVIVIDVDTWLDFGVGNQANARVNRDPHG